jgi:glycosyltransferase involved in cell wall biosynthesis
MPRERIDRRFDGYWRHLRWLGRTFEAVVCASTDLAMRLEGGGVGNLRTIPMGVEPGVFSPGRRNPALRAELLRRCGLHEDATLLLAAGRLAPEKRVPMLVEAATAAGRRNPVALVIFGEGRERPALVRAIAGNPHVRIFKPERDRQRFATLLASADALLHGCEAETFCMVAAEARASGIPVIVPDAGGAMDFASAGGGLRYRAARDEFRDGLSDARHSAGAVSERSESARLSAHDRDSPDFDGGIKPRLSRRSLAKRCSLRMEHRRAVGGALFCNRKGAGKNRTIEPPSPAPA